MKQIYLLRHKHIPHWVYVGATTTPRLHDVLCKKWCDKTRTGQSKVLLYKALRCSDGIKSDWEITQLHGFSEDWQELERLNIVAYDSYNNGLNSTASGTWEFTKAFISAILHNSIKSSKSVVCQETVIFGSMSEASRETGAQLGHISRCCSGKRKTAGGFTWRYA